MSCSSPAAVSQSGVAAAVGSIPTGESAVPAGSTEAKLASAAGPVNNEPPSEYRVHQMTEVSGLFLPQQLQSLSGGVGSFLTRQIQGPLRHSWLEKQTWIFLSVSTHSSKLR
ncbi:hypothetical protein CHARACLAT_016472 [Characodon lateralis]|uniref:Uncharacterized protein n=1 Tax=Characodon lateralis TaxID=208331 RepID=A0ABU7F3I9_9TELE|nr:hypothetical protein [Characodon lateralis]